MDQLLLELFSLSLAVAVAWAFISGIKVGNS